jgi:Spy/CpxP family protein refolding chaperone
MHENKPTGGVEMSKRVMILVGVAVIASLLVLAGGAVAFAQGSTPNPSQTPQPWGWGHMGGGMMGGQSLVDIAAQVIGIDRTQVVTELRAGKTLAQIAEEHDVQPQAIADAFIAARRAWLQQLVTDGRLTQAQADQMLAMMTTHVQQMLITPGGCNPGCPMCGTGGGPRGGRGGRR